MYPPKVSRRRPPNSPGLKYHLGPLLTTTDQVADCARRGSWIMWNQRPTHPSVIMSQQFGQLTRMLAAKQLRLAIRNKLIPLVFEAVWMEAFAGLLDVPCQEVPAWLISCHEIPAFSFETNASMAGVMSMCQAKARSLNHWGPVRVQFEKEMP